MPGKGQTVFQLNLTTNVDLRGLKRNLDAFLEENSTLLPKSAQAKILLKPNFNSNMNALTGNTTDLRVITCLIEVLQARGYKNITIGEGTNSGFYRNKIDVASRLRVWDLAKSLGVKLVDLNYSEGSPITFVNNKRAEVARDCLEADLFINLPKLKMHHEVGISVCLKNMMGCLVGQESKKKTHHSLAQNIVHLNKYVKPHLHIVDGLIAMEGNGPSDGLPVRMDTIVAGKDPYFIDMVCAELVGMPYREVTYLNVAEEMGLITPDHKEALGNLDLGDFKRDLLKPDVPLVTRIVCNPHLQKYFQMLRHAPGLYGLCNTKFVGNLFVRLGIRQEHFIEEDMHIDRMVADTDKCPPDCRKCKDYCPLGLDAPAILSESDDTACIKCLYCYMVCPEQCIHLDGTFGFLKAQIDKYDPLIRTIS
ncbi:MAG: DUF362 domain-containing protein [Planctomycetota bacterium]|jgi:uncharacterized protein (DUF362 family)/ferredoxin